MGPSPPSKISTSGRSSESLASASPRAGMPLDDSRSPAGAIFRAASVFPAE
jgi:hypothetical protein